MTFETIIDEARGPLGLITINHIVACDRLLDEALQLGMKIARDDTLAVQMAR